MSRAIITATSRMIRSAPPTPPTRHGPTVRDRVPRSCTSLCRPLHPRQIKRTDAHNAPLQLRPRAEPCLGLGRQRFDPPPQPHRRDRRLFLARSRPYRKCAYAQRLRQTLGRHEDKGQRCQDAVHAPPQASRAMLQEDRPGILARCLLFLSVLVIHSCPSYFLSRSCPSCSTKDFVTFKIPTALHQHISAKHPKDAAQYQSAPERRRAVPVGSRYGGDVLLLLEPPACLRAPRECQ